MFNLFSPREPNPSTTLSRCVGDALPVDEEKSKLTAALHALLESLSQSYNGQENIERLCQTIIEATPHLRFVWIGFCEAGDDHVAPYAAAGECSQEADDWRLPQSCFDYLGPYSQASQESIGEINELNSLFAPWQKNMDGCSAGAALAVPLRSEKSDLRGLLVFYADEVEYFAEMGVAPFQALSYVAEIIWQQSNLMQMLTHKTQFDALTGLMNRRKTMYVMGKAIERANETHEPLSLLICRIDDFDKMNEQYGWVAADEILMAFAKEISTRLRPQDKVGRWTSIEFLFVLPNTDTRQAEFFAQSLQAYVLSHPIKVRDASVRLNLTVSVTTHSKDSNGLEELVQLANHNMQGVLQAVSANSQ